MTRTAALLVFVACASTAVLPAQNASRARVYELVVLQPAASFSSEAVSVNLGGQVTGLASTTLGTRAFVAGDTTGLVYLDSQLDHAFPVDINAGNFVVGSSFDAQGSHATLWSPTGTPMAIPVAGASQAVPSAMNNSLVVVGLAWIGGWRSWVWDPAQGTRLLETLGLPPASTVADVNALAKICGRQPSGSAFRFDLATSTYLDLGTLGGDTSGALALNRQGHVVGWSTTATSNEETPFLWTPSQGMRSLGSLEPAAGLSGRALAVNDEGFVVGESEIAVDHPHAFLWDGAGMHDLNTLVRGLGPYELRTANQISNSGWIVGEAADTSAGSARVGFALRPR